MAQLRGIKLLLIDMDNTLCDTYHSLSMRQWEAVAAAFEQKGKAAQAQGFRKGLGKQGFVPTMRTLNLTPAEQRFALKAYDHVPVSHLRLYDDAPAILRLDMPKVLVSRGNRNLQLAKIRHLKVRPYFEKVVIVPTMERKGAAFARLLKEYGLKPSEVLIIGDRIEDEIADAKHLGIPTCLVRRTGWKVHPGVKPTITVWSLDTIAKRLSSGAPSVVPSKDL